MLLAHLSDLHLGFRRYQRTTPGGINQREADVARSFSAAIDRLIAVAPDVIVIAGDVFHSVRPSNPAILHAFMQFARLRRALPATPVIMIAGDHDTPRTAETGCILRLFEQLDVLVADREPRQFPFKDRDLTILAVPGLSSSAEHAYVPEPGFRHNVLVLHGKILGIDAEHQTPGDRASLEVSLSDLGLHRWSYVALGHFHVYREIAPNAAYSGSLDYTSLNVWGDLYEEQLAGIAPAAGRDECGKGFIVRNLETGEQRFERLPWSRRHVDLWPPIDARGLPAAEIDARLRARIESVPGGIDDQIVRVIVRDVPRHVARELDPRAQREYRRRALHFHLDVRRPDIVRLTGTGAAGRRPTLVDLVRDRLQRRPIETDLDRDELVRLGLHYLQEAEAGPVPDTAATPEA